MEDADWKGTGHNVHERSADGASAVKPGTFLRGLRRRKLTINCRICVLTSRSSWKHFADEKVQR
jgi:hypothetical protein